MSEGRRSQVVLLDERRLDIIIQTRLYAGELLDIVASHFTLKEKEYFGIAYADETGQHAWLQLDKRVLEHNFPKKSSQGTIIFYFKIKYFVESITQLCDSATIEAFYLQTKSLIAKGEFEIDSDIIFQLAALVIQATYGDYTDNENFKTHLKRLPVLPAYTLKEFSSISICEQQVLCHYKELGGQTRGAAIVNYLSIVESLPTYGQHYYEVKDKAGSAIWLGLSYRGISQYDKNDKRTPQRVFLWKQLENLYFRDRKFTVEVHDARRVVHTLSSFNLYEDAIEEPIEDFDDLSNAICDPTTQVSVSRRALTPASVTGYVWYAATASIARCIWSMAIAQHQFFLDRNQKKTAGRGARSLNQIASDLCRSVQSLSTPSPQPIVSRSNSSLSLPTIIVEGEISEESKVATMEMLSALQSRKDALQDALKKKTEELKSLCLKEGELTGELPPETPFLPGEAQPQVRRRIGTSFSISDKIIGRVKSNDRESLNNLELEYELQSKITSAAYKLANDVNARKSVRKIRKISYQQATSKLKNIEEKLLTLKKEKEIQKKKQNSEISHPLESRAGLPNSTSETSLNIRKPLPSILCLPVLPSSSLPHLSDGSHSSAPPSPSKNRQRHQSLQHVPAVTVDDVYEDIVAPFPSRRNSSSYSAASADYDAISCGGSSIASLGIYRNRFESHLDIDGTNHYSVPNRRASQAFNEPDELFPSDDNTDTVSRHSVDVRQPPNYGNNPGSISYDDKLAFNLSLRLPDDTNFEASSIISNGDETNFQLHHHRDLGRNDKYHTLSEHSLHRSQLGALHPKQNLHISEPELNLDCNVEPLGTIRHGYSVPTLKSAMRPNNCSFLLPGDHSQRISTQSINQVADLVQASVLLQDSKRVTASSAVVFVSPKSKAKEWIETSLDSPLVNRKRRVKVAESPSKVETAWPGKWLENGLPTATIDDQNTFYQQNAVDDDTCKNSHNSSDVRISSSHITAHDHQGGPDYVNIHSTAFPHKEERQFTDVEGHSEETPQYHYYENIMELSSSSPVPHTSYYENLPNYTPKKGLDVESIHNPQFDQHLALNTASLTNLSVAQPQEPPKLQASIENFSLLGANIPNDDYEPIEYRGTHHSSYEPEFQCDMSQYPRPHTYHAEPQPDRVPSTTIENAQNWQRFPSSPLPEDVPLSPTVSLSPNMEVNVVSVGYLKPYWEETKPYEISDFYKYSTKHRKKSTSSLESSFSHSNPDKNCRDRVLSRSSVSRYAEGAESRHLDSSDLQNVSSFSHHDGSLTAECYQNLSPTSSAARPVEEKDKSLSFGEMELRISLADTFHDEMVAWYQNQDSVKKATLV